MLTGGYPIFQRDKNRPLHEPWWHDRPRTALARYSREVARCQCQGPDEAPAGRPENDGNTIKKKSWWGQSPIFCGDSSIGCEWMRGWDGLCLLDLELLDMLMYFVSGTWLQVPYPFPLRLSNHHHPLAAFVENWTNSKRGHRVSSPKYQKRLPFVDVCSKFEHLFLDALSKVFISPNLPLWGSEIDLT